MAHSFFNQHFVRRREIFDCITVSCKCAQDARRKLPSRVGWLFVRFMEVGILLPRSSCRYQDTQVFDQKGELQGISGKRLEAVFLIESPGRLIFGVDDNGTQARDIGGLERAHQGIAQQVFSQSAALELSVDSQAGQNHDGHRVLGQTLPRAFRGFGVFDRTIGKGVIAGHFAGVGEC